MADKDISKGPHQDTDWFSSNNTLSQMQEVANMIGGYRSGDSVSRLGSIVSLLKMIMSS